MSKKHWLLIVVLLVLKSSTLGQAMLFVSPTGDDSHTGRSWSEAKQTVAGALAVASSGTTIHLAVGQYVTTAELTLAAGITLKGGYSTQSTGTDTTLHQFPQHNDSWADLSRVTLIEGDYGHRLFTVQNGARIEGCVLQKGMSTVKGGGLLLDGGTASHCIITQCMAHDNSQFNAKGGGVYMQSNARLLNCVICFNRADIGHGVAGSSGDAVSNTITQNYGTHCGTVSDIDGNTYATVIIGTQCWMREHLRTTHFADGTPILQGDNSSDITPLYYNIGSSGQETQTFGFLYNIPAARHGSQDTYSASSPSGIQGVCPNGWHLPSNAEFETMKASLGNILQNRCGNDNANIGKSLAAQSNWTASNSACAVGNDLTGNNSSLFDAQPAGFFNGSVSQIYHQATFWTASRSNDVSSRCTYRYLQYDEATLGESYAAPSYGCSVRCIKNY